MASLLVTAATSPAAPPMVATSAMLGHARNLGRDIGNFLFFCSSGLRFGDRRLSIEGAGPGCVGRYLVRPFCETFYKIVGAERREITLGEMITLREMIWTGSIGDRQLVSRYHLQHLDEVCTERWSREGVGCMLLCSDEETRYVENEKIRRLAPLFLPGLPVKSLISLILDYCEGDPGLWFKNRD